MSRGQSVISRGLLGEAGAGRPHSIGLRPSASVPRRGT